MTIYEQIQRALDHIEANLCSHLTQERAANEAGMSTRGFQSYFWMVTGFSFKEYLIKRRLQNALAQLKNSKKQVLHVALEIGYLSHESFTRAFKNEFGVSPATFRKGRQDLKGTERIKLFKEMYMGVIIKELPEMSMIVFTGFSPDPEDKAKEKMNLWLKEHPDFKKPFRIFGHNINAQGNLTTGPLYDGYKFYLQIREPVDMHSDTMERIEAGKFVVTGIEGKIEQAGNFIPAGWKRLNDMILQKGYKVKSPVRWFEEELEPSLPGNLRLDLYLEIE